MQSVLILGRQPALGLAELESLYGGKVRALGDTAALLDVGAVELDFGRLGGSVKAAKVLTSLETAEWRNIERYLIDNTPEHAGMLPEGKLTIGLSSYGFKVSAGQLNALGLSIKKAIRKQSDRSVRLVPNNETELSSAQIFHNHLTSERAWELLLIRDETKTILAQTFAVQDIDGYTLRDRGRPKRDTRVGMLPPKLAQIIINLATGDKIPKGTVVLDPFCGTGVVLQEALLMGYDVYGSDLEPRMIDYTGENLDWLDSHFELPEATMHIEPGDATRHRWEPAADCVASETYLGKPFTTTPDQATLSKTVSEVDLIAKKFLKNIHGQLKPGARLCLAVPAWQIRPGQFKHLPLVDQISNLSYNYVRFEHVRDDQLLYYREDQTVARQLLVLTKR
jgi:tRNA G10  N-methylase Trm11